MASSEQYGFVFAVTFIIVFAGLVAIIPSDLQGQGSSVEISAPVNPQLLTGFNEYNNWTKGTMSGSPPVYSIQYKLNTLDWYCVRFDGTDSFQVSYKIYWAGFLWLGGLSRCDFISPEGQNLGISLTTEQIDADADDGEVRYNLLDASGNDAGGFVLAWNTSAYATNDLAWDADALYILHGIGLNHLATNNAGALLVGLLLLQLPDVPAGIQLLIVSPMWACIVYVLWFIVKEMIPFV